MSEPEITTFEQFWDFYVSQHDKKATRVAHFIGTTAAMGLLAGGLLTKRRWLLLLAPVAGYGPAWFSHFFIEKNTPATFQYPLWSLQADLVMWWKMVKREMDAEVERVRQQTEARSSEKVEASTASSTPHETIN
jgi:hypothetical protein